jgi:hypothetical protein
MTGKKISRLEMSAFKRGSNLVNLIKSAGAQPEVNYSSAADSAGRLRTTRWSAVFLKPATQFASGVP